MTKKDETTTPPPKDTRAPREFLSLKLTAAQTASLRAVAQLGGKTQEVALTDLGAFLKGDIEAALVKQLDQYQKSALAKAKAVMAQAAPAEGKRDVTTSPPWPEDADDDAQNPGRDGYPSEQ